MITFSTDKPLTKRQFFLQTAWYLIIYLVLLLIVFLFFPHKVDNAPFLSIGFLIVGIVRLLQVEKVQEIRFDEEKKELHFYSKGYLTKLKKLKTSFENIHVRKDDWQSKRKWLPKRKILALEILKEKKLVFTVDMAEDSFSEEKMRAIIATFHANNIPVQ
jgi:hypothetical protein